MPRSSINRHNETSSGITRMLQPSLKCAIGETSFILDGITSIGGMPVDIDGWNVEAAAMGAQKCTAGPSGIAAIAFNSKFYERCKTIKEQDDVNVLFYLDFISAYKKGDDDQTPWTPAINLAMVGESLKVLKDEGLENRWNRCQNLATGVQFIS